MLRTGRRTTLYGVAVLLSLGAASASAVTTRSYAEWDPLVGTANNYATVVRPPVPGFPRASVATDSRGGGVGVQSGANSWFGENTPPGLAYGSSRDRPYLLLRPRADNATNPSTTTYVFERPTPPTGWMVAFADIDADQVTVHAKDASGAEVSASDLGFRGGFNLCDTTPRPSQCSTSVGDVPSWSESTQTLLGNPTASDTVGPTGWFEPTVPLSSMTVSFQRRAGLPTYSTLFASRARTISGTVSDVSTSGGECPVTGVSVRLRGPYGNQLATTTPAPDGSYSFGQLATQPGYTVSVETPGTCAVVGPVNRTVSTSTTDAVAAFSVREVIPQPVSGTVRADGQRLPGVQVTLHAPDGSTRTTVTGADGSYLFDDNAVDDGYFVTIAVPVGYSGPDQRSPFDVDTTPITTQDFALTADPDVSGTVRGGGAGLGGVTVTLVPASGPPRTTVTAADGSYTFARVAAGTYDVSVSPPVGFDPPAPIEDVAVATADVTRQDFALSRPGAIGGTVMDGEEPVAGARLSIDGPGRPVVSLTDTAGQFFLGGLAAGSYVVELTAPEGFTPEGPTVRRTTISAAGEVRGGIDFVVAPLVGATPSPSPSASATPAPPSATPAVVGSTSGAPGGGSSTLPDTGGPVSGTFVLAGVVLLGAGVLLLVGGWSARRRGR